MKILFSVLAFFIVGIGKGQEIPKKANTIIVHGVTFSEVCNALLDSGYNIDKKDNDLQTVRTEAKQYPKYWNATYIIDIRVKDSIAYISGKLTAPPQGGLFNNEPIFYQTKKDGVPYPKSLFTVAFIWMNNIALSFNKPVEYSIQ